MMASGNDPKTSIEDFDGGEEAGEPGREAEHATGDEEAEENRDRESPS